MMGGPMESNVSTTLSDDELQEFEMDWSLLWKPSITQDQLAQVEQAALDFQGSPEAQGYEEYPDPVENEEPQEVEPIEEPGEEPAEEEPLEKQ